MTRLDGGRPLTRRDSELHPIAGALVGPGGVLLAGAAGVGKTRLARDALATHTADRAHWVIATDSAAGVPGSTTSPRVRAHE